MVGAKLMNVLFKRKRFDTPKRYKSCINSESHKHPKIAISRGPGYYSYTTIKYETYGKWKYTKSIHHMVKCTKKYANNMQKKGRAKQPLNQINKQLKKK